MSFKEVLDLDCEVATPLGGVNKKTGKKNPTQIEGYFLGTRSVPSKLGKNGLSNLHIFQTENGRLGVWGKTDLDRKLNSVSPGTMTRASFTGTQPTKYGDMAKFKVELDASNTIEVDPSLFNNAPETNADSYEEVSDDDSAGDEITPPRPSQPAVAASAPDAARQAKVQALLSGKRNS